MANRITNVNLFHSAKDPTFAQISVSVYPETITSTTEVRGVLAGPRCAYATTVEVAYPLREFSRFYEKEDNPHIIAHAKIPEPSLWEPETPFWYHGTVELWQKGVLCDRVSIVHRLRDLTLNAAGFRLNGRPYTLRGVWHNRLTPDHLPILRESGFNTIMTQPALDGAELWNEADRLGFFLIAWLPDLASVRNAYPISDHTATLACIIPAGVEEPEAMDLFAATVLPLLGAEQHVGHEVVHNMALPRKGSFLFCTPDLLPSLASVGVPKLLHLAANGTHVTYQALSAEPGVIGWVLETAT